MVTAKERDRSYPSNAIGHKHDGDDDIADAGTDDASIAMDIDDESRSTS